VSAADSSAVPGSPVHVYVGPDTDDVVCADLEQRLTDAGIEARLLRSEAELAAALPEIVFLLFGHAPRLDWAPARRLRLLQGTGRGVDSLFPARGLPETVAVANTRGAIVDSVRDHALAMMLALARDLPMLLDQQRAAVWRARAAAPIRGRTVAVLGLGAIGGAVAQACAALGMKVRGTRRRPDRPPPPGVERVLGPGETRAALAGADFAVVTVPLTPETRGLVNAAALAALPATAALVNVSRGAVVDEAALFDALVAGRLRGAACDVFADEPLPSQSPLWSCPRLIVTPHVAGWTPDYVAHAAAEFAANVARARAGLPPVSPVSRQLGY
jgi:phosphoglycerate dehydrogenase-like enzyme